MTDTPASGIADEIPQSVLSIASSGDHRRDQEGAPKPYKAEARPQFRNSILAMLETRSFASCAGVDNWGWPFGFVAPLVAKAGADNRPIIYLALPSSAPELELLRSNPRVSVGSYVATGFENRREAKGVQLQGLATVLQSGSDEASTIQSPDLPPSMTPHGSLGKDAIWVRVDGLAAVNFDAGARPQWGFLDYTDGESS